MKKIYTFGAIALAVLATLSCKQELSVEVQPADNLFHIYATRENPLTKTGWTPEANDYSIAWGAHDELSVFATDDPNPADLHNLFFYIENAAAYTAYINSGYKTISFTHGSAEIPGTAPYWAVFPYDRSNVMDTGLPQIPFKYEQTANAGFFDPKAYAAVAKSDNFIFSFKNIFGLLAIKVGDANVTSIKLKNKSEGDGFHSRYTIGFYEDIPYCMPTAGVPVPEITLSPGEGTFTVNQTYYMVVPPKDFTEGAVFSLYNGENLLGTLTTAAGVSVDRAKVHFVPTLTLGEQPGPGPEGNTISEIVAQITSTDSAEPSEYSVKNLAGAVVSYVNGKYVYIEDESAAILLFLENSGLEAGDVISGALSGTGYLYRGLPEITSLGEAYSKKTGGTIPETTITLADLSENHTANLSRRILVKGVTVTDGIKDGDRNGTITQGAGVEYPVYSQLNNQGLELKAGDIGDMVLFVGVYNTTNQLLFWDNSFFTQTGAVTNLTVTESLSVSAGNTKTINVETNSTGAVSFVSSKPSVATVDDKGVVTGVSEGTAEITVSVAADGFYEAVAKVCAVTVTAAAATSIVYLTNEEIVAAVKNSSGSYTNIDIESTSGTWKANAYCATTLSYLQLRNKSGSKLTSPKFSGKIDKIVVDMASNATSARTLHAIPTSVDVPTSSSNYNSTLWADQFGKVGTGTDGGEVTIEFTGDTNDFTLVVEGGTTYIDAITIYLK